MTQEEAGDRAEAVDALMDVSRLMTAVVARTLADVEHTVTVPQLRVLVMLHGSGSRNLTAIAEGLGVNPSNATRTCSQLVAAGLVRRRTDRADRRASLVTLTTRGRALVDSLMDARRHIFDDLVQELTVEECRQLATGLAGLLAAADGTGSETRMEGTAILPWIR